MCFLFISPEVDFGALAFCGKRPTMKKSINNSQEWNICRFKDIITFFSRFVCLLFMKIDKKNNICPLPSCMNIAKAIKREYFGDL